MKKTLSLLIVLLVIGLGLYFRPTTVNSNQHYARQISIPIDVQKVQVKSSEENVEQNKEAQESDLKGNSKNKDQPEYPLEEVSHLIHAAAPLVKEFEKITIDLDTYEAELIDENGQLNLRDPTDVERLRILREEKFKVAKELHDYSKKIHALYYEPKATITYVEDGEQKRVSFQDVKTIMDPMTKEIYESITFVNNEVMASLYVNVESLSSESKVE